jgi:hypothetical protein
MTGVSQAQAAKGAFSNQQSAISYRLSAIGNQQWSL